MPEKTGFIRFSVDRIVDGFTFKTGETYELPLSSCERWVRRDVAVFVNGPEPKPKAKAKVPDFETTNIEHRATKPEPPVILSEELPKAEGPSGAEPGKND